MAYTLYIYTTPVADDDADGSHRRWGSM